MTAQEIRQTFLDFFKSKDHRIVPSAPIVNKDDPTLMFTNAGMNQFKDSFLGNKPPVHPRIADTQKCLRVSGKHNDLEEVGRDSYHHTMFEMLGNWSFGDYFKKEAIAWAWELLTDVYGLDPERLYASVFAGDESEQLDTDLEAENLWKQYLPGDRILRFGKKDNFWEMGDTGPCGPCSEIHIDLRSDEERAILPGRKLVNESHPQVIEIWNLVFIQYNRKSDGSLEELPAKHVDTGMGFERLCMAIQGKKSNYDTDVFTPFIELIENTTGVTYTGRYEEEAKSDIAMRVATDHVRAVSFTIADGQLPSNTGAGYVIRRILRRAVRYNFSFLGQEQPFLHTLIPLLADRFQHVFPELKAQEEFVRQVIFEEERSFLRTLAAGLKKVEQAEVNDGVLDGAFVFELYDTYGFPIDLTRLIAAERGLTVDEEGFQQALEAQRNRSRADASKETGDWVVLREGSSQFVGYDQNEVDATSILKYRQLLVKGKPVYQLVLETTPFYAEGGGQVGDTGTLWFGGEAIRVIDTIKENDLFIHLVSKLPDASTLKQPVKAVIDTGRRRLIENNHSATHLLHAALRQVLGDHVHQKGSLVTEDYLRFDFSHFKKVEQDELDRIEQIVNAKIREDIHRGEDRGMPIEQAKAAGAMMLFGEKYGDTVRMITFDPGYSRELCGGCHVGATGKIGLFKITAESAVAAGVRRIEAKTAIGAETMVRDEEATLRNIRQLVKSQQDPTPQIEQLLEENRTLKQKIEALLGQQAVALKAELAKKAKSHDGFRIVAEVVQIEDSKVLKDLVFQLEATLQPAVVAIGSAIDDKPQLLIKISQSLVDDKGWHAGNLVRDAAKAINGGGGGQAFFASAGGSDAGGLGAAIDTVRKAVGG
ncbi:MAG TPA: alanine--tRNA ligase [Saprospiraceae bacterium]|nr:alanine--tRNA ligase [Saprospiraceae bacterium]HRV84263.1 alanine--tRNA ligase [Saprospiraceae bacterium]